MTNISKYDVVVVKFPFASSLKYKARPAVVISPEEYNENSRNTLLILAISSNTIDKLNLEKVIDSWQSAGLLKPSIFKASIATIEKDFVITTIGKLDSQDKENLTKMLEEIC